MERKNNQKFQLVNDAAEILKELKDNVSAKEKREAAAETGLTEATITRYLQGKVADLDKAELLIVYFRKCAKRRADVFSLQQAVPA